MSLENFRPKMCVKYVPNHAFGDKNHPDCELGIVSSVNHKYVFVKFDKQLAKFGWDGTTSQSCLVENLEIL